MLKHNKAFAVLLFFGLGFGSVYVSLDADGRVHWQKGREPQGEVNVVSLSFRKTFSDSRGDRFMIAGLAEAGEDQKDIGLHELYGRYKGPLGKWNLTAGRFTLPYGLLSSYSSKRLLSETIDHQTLGIHVDNGLLLSGVTGRFEYALSFTQGLGAHHDPTWTRHGLAMGRLGLALSDTEEILVGISGAAGHTARHSDAESLVRRELIGMDATGYWGPVLGRVELNAGSIDSESFTGFVLLTDVALSPVSELIFSGSVVRQAGKEQKSIFAGLQYRLPWFTFGAGIYHHNHHAGESYERLSIQIYRLVNFNI